MVKRTVYLPSGYKRSNVTRTEGRARTGEVGPQGTVTHTEHWDGRLTGSVQRSTVRYVRDPDGHIRPMTMAEMVAKRYFTLGRGPSGFRMKGST